jgi:hypothetical protein
VGDYVHFADMLTLAMPFWEATPSWVGVFTLVVSAAGTAFGIWKGIQWAMYSRRPLGSH